MGELADFLNDPGESDSQPAEQPAEQPAAGGLAAELNPVTDPQGQEDFYDRMRKQNKVADIFREEALKTDMPASPEDTTDYVGRYSLPSFQKRLQDEAPWLTDRQRQAQYDQFRQQAPLAAQGSALDAALKKARSGDINRLTPLSPGQERVLRDLPLMGGAISAITGQGSAAAQERFRQGKATQSDINTIALDTAEQEREAKKGGLERTVNVAEKLPAFLTEWSMLAGPAGAGRAAAQAAVERGLGLGAESLAAKEAGALGAGAVRTLLRPDIPIAAAAQGQSPGRAALDQMVQNTVFEGLNPFVRRQGDALLARWAKGMGTAMSANEAAADIQDVFKGKLPQSGPFAALAHADTPQERQRAWDNLKAQVAAFGGLEGFINARGSIAEQMARRTEEPARPTPGIIATPEATQMSPSQTERLNPTTPAGAKAEAPVPEKPGEIAPGSTQAAQAAPAPPEETAPPAQSQTPPAALKEAMARVGLSKFEQKVVRDRLDGNSHQDIANDLMLSRQRVQQIERGAMKKLGADFSMEDFNATRREEEQGEAGEPGRIDLPQGPPTAEEQAAVKRAKAPLSAQERKGRALQALADKLLENAHEPLSDSERASYEAEAARIVNGSGEEPAASGPARGLPGEAAPAAAPRNVVPGAAEYAGGGEGGAAPGEGAGPAGEPAGAAAPEPAGQPGAGEPVAAPVAAVPPPRGDPTDPGVRVAKAIAGEESGAVNVGQLGRHARNAYDHLKKMAQYVFDAAGKLGGRIAPATSRLDPEAGNSVARYDASRGLAEEQAAYYPEVVLGREGVSDESLARKVGATIFEERARDAKAQLADRASQSERAAVQARQAMMRAQTPDEFDRLKAAAERHEAEAKKDRKDAAKIVTVVGANWSPFQTNADFLAAQADPQVRAAVDRYDREYVPVKEDNFRRNQGLDDTDPIGTITQRKAGAVSAYPIQEEGQKPGAGTRGQGYLGNPKIRKLSTARDATLAAGQYEIDIRKIIARDLLEATPKAAKAEMARTLVEKGLAKWGMNGELGIEFGGKKAVEFPEVAPPRGTQTNQFVGPPAPGRLAETMLGARQKALFVHPDVAPEVRQVLKVDEMPGRVPYLSRALDTVTAGSLVGAGGEVTSHTSNLLGMLTSKAGLNIKDFVTRAKQVFLNDPQMQKDWLELTRIGATKAQHGLESGELYQSKYNPLTLTGRVLDKMDKIMRLTAGDAFDRLAGQKGLMSKILPEWLTHRVENTEQNKRDFINQLGNYSKGTQSRMAVFLRNSGLGSFATAGTNFMAQGVRAVHGSSGVRATSYAHAAGLRAETFARLAAAPAAAALVNYLMWNNVWGDDKTPWGAIKTGTDPKTGETTYMDATALTGPLRRGAKMVGLNAAIEGTRAGASSRSVKTQAFREFTRGLVHPAMGPGAAFIDTAFTGKDAIGRQVAYKPGPESSEPEEDIKAALRDVSPLYPIGFHAFTGKDMKYHEHAAEMLGPYNPARRSKAPPGREVKVHGLKAP